MVLSLIESRTVIGYLKVALGNVHTAGLMLNSDFLKKKKTIFLQGRSITFPIKCDLL